jgi:hypothetical protein
VPQSKTINGLGIFQNLMSNISPENNPTPNPKEMEVETGENKGNKESAT